ncbi:MAG: ATP-dependent zinc metalloprotease FtsH, partial [Spirochaetia bacterium]|nr:ATP-dependent zinc metalloprotease FtsH [Spirochaetia bacterium]
GVGASRVRDLFDQAKKNSPCIVFIDEIDAVGRLRGAGLGGGHDEREQTLNQMLVEMDGFEENEGIIVIAATNRPDVLDPALLRPGRFDRQVVVDAPDIVGREAILKIHAKKVPLTSDVSLNQIARGTPGFTGADLANLINEAALLAARRDKRRVTQEELEEAKDKVMMGPERRSFIITPKEKEVIAYHEAGHALIGSLLPYAEPVHKVTIIPRGRALGLTQQLPLDDKHIQPSKYWLDRICVLMGGYLAEELIFEDTSTGASNDIQVATNIARRMVCEWGMSEKLGTISYSNNNDSIFLGREISSNRSYSDETAFAIDDEVKRIVSEQTENGRSLLLKHKDKLESMAKWLLANETLSGAELIKIVGSDASESQKKILENRESSVNEPEKPIDGEEMGVAAT